MSDSSANDGLRRYVLALLAVVLTITALYFGKQLVLQLLVGGLLSFLVLPLARRVERRLPRWAGAMVATFTLVLVVLGVFFVIGWQLASFGDQLPELRERAAMKGELALRWIEERTAVSRRDQITWFNSHLSSFADWGGKAAMKLFSGTGSALADVAPIPVFIFLVLLLKDRFRNFFKQLSGEQDDAVLDVMVRISALSRKYLRGVITVALIFGSLCSIGFLTIGLKYAVLLGFLLALLNVIPYVGALVGSMLPVLVALVMNDSLGMAIGALAVVLVVQALDNNFITPKVVGSSVSINPLASLVALIGFGQLWGVAGMLLAIPLMGMLKVVCDSVPGLRPWGYLLGEEIETPKEKRFHLHFGKKHGGPPAHDGAEQH